MDMEEIAHIYRSKLLPPGDFLYLFAHLVLPYPSEANIL